MNYAKLLKAVVALSIPVPYLGSGIGAYAMDMVREDAVMSFFGLMAFGAVVLGLLAHVIITDHGERGVLCMNFVIGYWIMASSFVVLAFSSITALGGPLAIGAAVAAMLLLWVFGSMTMLSLSPIARLTEKLYEPRLVAA